MTRRASVLAAALVMLPCLVSAHPQAAFFSLPVGAASTMALAAAPQAGAMVAAQRRGRIAGRIGAVLARFERIGAVRMGAFSTVDHSLNLWMNGGHNSRAYLGIGVRW